MCNENQRYHLTVRILCVTFITRLFDVRIIENPYNCEIEIAFLSKAGCPVERLNSLWVFLID